MNQGQAQRIKAFVDKMSVEEGLSRSKMIEVVKNEMKTENARLLAMVVFWIEQR